MIVKFVLALVAVLLLNATIANWVLQGIDAVGIDLGILGVWLNNVMNVVTGTVIIALLLNFIILRPIRRMVVDIQTFQAGELNHRISIKNEDELGVLSNKLNSLFAEVEKHNQQQEKHAQATEDTVETLDGRLNQLSEKTAEVNEAIESIEAQAQTQLATYEETATITDNMDQGMQQMAAQLQDIASGMSETEQTASKGEHQIEETSEAIQQLSEEAEASNHEIQDLSEEIQKIERIVGVIEDFSEQTNLLALNASIEAARAGESGKGFAVVAEEVRKLAEHSMDATKDIKTSVQSVIGKVEQTVQRASDRVKSMEESASSVGEMRMQFQHIIKDLKASSQQVQTVNRSLQSLSESSSEIQQTVEADTKELEKTTENVSEISTSIEEQLETTEAIRAEVKRFHEALSQNSDVDKKESHTTRAA